MEPLIMENRNRLHWREPTIYGVLGASRSSRDENHIWAVAIAATSARQLKGLANCEACHCGIPVPLTVGGHRKIHHKYDQAL